MSRQAVRNVPGIERDFPRLGSLLRSGGAGAPGSPIDGFSPNRAGDSRRAQPLGGVFSSSRSIGSTAARRRIVLAFGTGPTAPAHARRNAPGPDKFRAWWLFRGFCGRPSENPQRLNGDAVHLRILVELCTFGARLALPKRPVHAVWEGRPTIAPRRKRKRLTFSYRP